MLFGYINIIEEKKSRSIFDYFFESNQSNKLSKYKPKIIFEFGTSYSDSDLIELNTYPIDKQYDSLRLITKYDSFVPLYISNLTGITWFRRELIDKKFNIVFPFEINIDSQTENKYSCSYYSLDGFVFGIWKLHGNKNRYLVGWNNNEINREFLLYLVHWIFIKN